MSAPDRANNPKRRFAQDSIKYQEAVGPILGKRVQEMRNKLDRPVNHEEYETMREGVHKELGITRPKREDY